MNHSNKDGKSSAESEEGRLLIKENTFPSGTFPTQSGCVYVSHGVGKCADKFHAWPLSICEKPHALISARADPRGGRSAMIVPTATSKP